MQTSLGVESAPRAPVSACMRFCWTLRLNSRPYRFLRRLQTNPESAVTKIAKALMCSGVTAMTFLPRLEQRGIYSYNTSESVVSQQGDAGACRYCLKVREPAVVDLFRPTLSCCGKLTH